MMINELIDRRLRMNKKVTKKLAIALCGVALTGTAMPVIANNRIQTVSATPNHKGFNNWIQYGTLKYALKGASGHVYPAGTKVARYLGSLDRPSKTSYPKLPFLLTLSIAQTPGTGITQFGGGKIAETFVNFGDWQEIADPPLDDFDNDSGNIVQSTEDYTDLASSDFHPVDSNNPDVPYANTDALRKAYSDYIIDTDFSHLSDSDRELSAKIDKSYQKCTSIGATQTEVDQLTAEINQAIANYKRTGHLTDSGATDKPTTPSTNPTTPTTGSSTTTPSPTIPTSKSHYVKLRKASYRYTHKGKRVSKKLLKKGSVVKINGKVYRIKGKTFYRIAKNRYIRVVNVSK